MNPLNPHNAIRNEVKETKLGDNYPLDVVKRNVKDLQSKMESADVEINMLKFLYSSSQSKLPEEMAEIIEGDRATQNEIFYNNINLSLELRLKELSDDFDKKIEKSKKITWCSFHVSIVLAVCMIPLLTYFFEHGGF